MKGLFSTVFRLALLAGFTFGFVVLFEHGPEKFVPGAKTEWNALLVFAGSVFSGQEGATPPSVEGANRPARGAPGAIP